MTEEMKLDTTEAIAAIVPMAGRIRAQMRLAASVAILDIDENEKQAIEAIRKESGEKRGKIRKKLEEALAANDFKTIRKWPHLDNPDNFGYFLGDQTKVGNFGGAYPGSAQ